MSQNEVRLIDANAFVQMLRAHVGNTSLGQLFIGLINTQPTIATCTGWTRAADDLPKESGYYYCMHGGERKICWFWAEPGCFEINGKKTKKVTHWMELPAPPKEE